MAEAFRKIVGTYFKLNKNKNVFAIENTRMLIRYIKALSITWCSQIKCVCKWATFMREIWSTGGKKAAEAAAARCALTFNADF
jgi:hypothetical protein